MRRFWNAFTGGIQELRFHPLRSMLSLLGIILGVMNLTAMFSIMNGARIANENFIQSLGTPDLISISLDWDKYRFATDTSAYSLGWNDVESLENNATTIKAVGVEVSMYKTLQYGDSSDSYRIIGITPDTFDMLRYELEEGRRILEYDMELANAVCILGPTVTKEIFGDLDPLGKSLQMGDEFFKVIGVYSAFGSYTGEDADSDDNPLDWKNQRVLIPASTAFYRFVGWESDDWFTLYVQAKSVDKVSSSIKEVKDIMMKTHNDQDIFEIESMMEFEQDQGEFARIWTIVLGVVSGISLLVGGVGIMNVLLASFRERMKEIGIRKAVGANNSDIFLLFIVETLIICVIGGFIGLALGYWVSTSALNEILEETFEASAQFSTQAGMIAVLFSLGVGMLAGLYPAFKAAKLSPVEALGFK